MKQIFGTILAFLVCSIQLMAQNIVEYNVEVSGACGMCAERIESAAIKQGKAESASYDVESQMLTVNIDEEKTSISRVRYEVSLVGHDSGNFIAPQDVYDNLHSCCKYRDIESSHVEGVASFEGLTQGYVNTKNDKGELIPLIGASVSVNKGAIGTITDLNGFFTIENPDGFTDMTVSYVGYETQSFEIEGTDLIDVILADGINLQTVEITYKKRSTELSFIDPINAENITRAELNKAACCNLSESFETNPSVDVSFNDAVTGTKQIQMLGLAGPYVQINRELMPDIRGLNNTFGLLMTPGSWIESIQLVKGTGSVVNGFESIAGQINVELKKPNEGEILHLNGFVNNGGRVELNANARQDLTDKISTSLLVQGTRLQNVHDNNGDSFTDMPQRNDYIIANRWKLEETNGIVAQLGIKLAKFDRSGGSHDHFAGLSKEHELHWQMFNETTRNEVWGKLGYIFPDNPNRSIGFQWSLVDHEQIATFGNRFYDNEGRSAYGNLMFQNIFENGNTIRTGLSYQLDHIDERVAVAGAFQRREAVPGAYAEFTYKKGERFTVIPGIRVDHHNNYGTFVTPRLHAKYNFSDRSIVRLTAGSGFRTANIFAENMGLFASARLAGIEGNNPENPYGLDAEEAWNYGINFTHAIDVKNREMIFALDLFRTDFVNQIVADFEDPRRVDFYNLEGSSYSNSIQAKIDYELFESFDVRVAYRLLDVQTTIDGELIEQPFVSKHRAFVNLAYATKSDWKFDTTINWRGSQRLPSTRINPEAYQRLDRSPNYALVNAQVSKAWGDKFEIYLGAENLFNYRQNDAVIASEDAFGEFFDASIVWAPLFGTNVYLGFRYNLLAD